MTGKYIKRKLKKAYISVRDKIKNVPYEIKRKQIKKLVKDRNFSVISNNCWAGKLYQYLDMPYLSPTAGLYFFAEDYLKFIKNLKYYLSLELEFISADESRFCDTIKKRGHDEKPIGRLDDVEIVFLHYPTKEEAKEKWDRRKARVNYDDLIFKFSNMNCCTEEMIAEFDDLPFKNKFVLNIRKEPKYKSEIYWNGENDGNEIIVDSIPFPGNIDLNSILKK